MFWRALFSYNTREQLENSKTITKAPSSSNFVKTHNLKVIKTISIDDYFILSDFFFKNSLKSVSRFKTISIKKIWIATLKKFIAEAKRRVVMPFTVLTQHLRMSMSPVLQFSSVNRKWFPSSVDKKGILNISLRTTISTK